MTLTIDELVIHYWAFNQGFGSNHLQFHNFGPLCDPTGKKESNEILTYKFGFFTQMLQKKKIFPQILYIKKYLSKCYIHTRCRIFYWIVSLPKTQPIHLLQKRLTELEKIKIKNWSRLGESRDLCMPLLCHVAYTGCWLTKPVTSKFFFFFIETPFLLSFFNKKNYFLNFNLH